MELADDANTHYPVLSGKYHENTNADRRVPHSLFTISKIKKQPKCPLKDE